MNKLAKTYFKSDKRIKVWRIDNDNNGPSLLITAGVHGGENTPVQVAFELIDYFKNENNLHGKVTIIPIVNVEGYVKQLRESPSDKKNINASGNNGNGKIAKYTHSDAVADELIDIAKNHDYYLDLHSATKSRYLSHVYFNEKADMDLARSFGLYFAVVHRETKIHKIPHQENNNESLFVRARKLGVLAFGLELGAGIMVRRKDVNMSTGGIKAFCFNTGILKGKSKVKKTPKNQVFLKNRNDITTVVRAPRSGSIYFTKSLGEVIRKGSVVAIIVDLESQKRCEIKSPVGGRLILKRVLAKIEDSEVGRETIFRIMPKSAY